MKEQLHVKCYLRYCDDVVFLGKTKGEIKWLMREYITASDRMGLCVKANFEIALIKDEKRKSGKRKRQRGRNIH